MKHFRSLITEHKDAVIGAACFRDPLTATRHCANGLTQQEAERFAKMHKLQLLKWHAGKKCSQIQCAG